MAKTFWLAQWMVRLAGSDQNNNPTKKESKIDSFLLD